MSSRRHTVGLCAASAAVFAALIWAGDIAGKEAGTLSPATSFAAIGDERERSLALFGEASKVITHPRCINCHPAARRALQGEDSHPHVPKVAAGQAGVGSPGIACTACHGVRNVALVGTTLKSMPGHPRWHLAPSEMAWEGQPLGEICRQIKDPSRNGGRDLAALHDHMAHDDLVGWGWNPGAGREPAPGTQALFGDLIQAWIATGAACP